jgi:hypothetical protein
MPSVRIFSLCDGFGTLYSFRDQLSRPNQRLKYSPATRANNGAALYLLSAAALRFHVLSMLIVKISAARYPSIQNNSGELSELLRDSGSAT